MNTLPPYFIGPLRFECPPDNDSVMTLVAPLVFVDSVGEQIEAPAGLETDGTSVGALLGIPIIGWLVRLALGGDQFTGPFRWPAVVHDAEYARASEYTVGRAIFSTARAAADRRMFEGARSRHAVLPGGRVIIRDHAAWWRAAIVHAMLRLAGWKAWMDDCSRAQRSLENLERELRP